MLSRKDIFKHVKQKYGTSPDYPWEKFPDYASLRHDSNEKWYGLIMNVLPEKIGLEGDKEVDVLNVKSHPETSETLRDGKSILQGYHMDKEHWITIVLKNMDSKEDVYRLIEESFKLTK